MNKSPRKTLAEKKAYLSRYRPDRTRGKPVENPCQEKNRASTPFGVLLGPDKGQKNGVKSFKLTNRIHFSIRRSRSRPFMHPISRGGLMTCYRNVRTISRFLFEGIWSRIGSGISPPDAIRGNSCLNLPAPNIYSKIRTKTHLAMNRRA
jgi:hypothetical protein